MRFFPGDRVKDCLTGRTGTVDSDQDGRSFGNEVWVAWDNHTKAELVLEEDLILVEKFVL